VIEERATNLGTQKKDPSASAARDAAKTGTIQRPLRHHLRSAQAEPHPPFVGGEDDIDAIGTNKPPNEMYAQAADGVAKKLASHYDPPISSMGNWKKKYWLEIVVAEEIANIGKVEPTVRILKEIDCADRMQRELSVHIIKVKGMQPVSNDRPSEWQHTAPETIAVGA
jgi:hypothetical protein